MAMREPPTTHNCGGWRSLNREKTFGRGGWGILDREKPSRVPSAREKATRDCRCTSTFAIYSY